MDDTSATDQFERPQLALHEYLAVMIIIGFFAMLTLIAIFHQESLPEGLQSEAHYLKPQIIEIFVQGAVESPGSYKVKVGAKVQDVIAQSKPLNKADLRRFKPSSKVRPGQIITVPSRPMMTINVSGAVETPGQVQVPRGTRLQELGKYVPFSSAAAPEKIKHKTLLKDNDSIFVPQGH